MAFTDKKSTKGFKKGSQDGERKPWRKVLSIVEGDKGTYCKVNNYKGRLLWQEGEGEDAKYYLIKFATFQEKTKFDPDFVAYNVSINLENENAVELIVS